jgi:hypothetical protein
MGTVGRNPLKYVPPRKGFLRGYWTRKTVQPGALAGRRNNPTDYGRRKQGRPEEATRPTTEVPVAPLRPRTWTQRNGLAEA